MSEIDIRKAPTAPDFVRFREGFGQKFIVTVDTEEEFDWDAPLDRDAHSVVTVSALQTFQTFCDEFGVTPIYLLNYPVVDSSMTGAVLQKPVQEGRAEVGVHLHPWVNPPFTEEVSEANSFAGNLPAELERDKLGQLYRAIHAKLGAAPMIYRAGRYGIGPNSAALLTETGIAIDTSVRAKFDYGSSGGPNFNDHPLRPYWIGRDKRLMELPVTTVYWGMLRQLGDWIYPRMWRMPSMRGVLSKAGLLERIPLTPEGISPSEAIRGIDIALDDGLPLLVFSFHSPSLAPGYTPYVRSDEDLEAFYDWWREIFAYLAQRNVAPSSVKDIMESVELA